MFQYNLVVCKVNLTTLRTLSADLELSKTKEKCSRNTKHSVCCNWVIRYRTQLKLLNGAFRKNDTVQMNFLVVSTISFSKQTPSRRYILFYSVIDTFFCILISLHSALFFGAVSNFSPHLFRGNFTSFCCSG